MKSKLFLLFSILSIFAISLEYAITRPTSNCLFLTYFSSAAFPWVWLLTVPVNLCIIYAYNRFLPRLGPYKTLCLFALVTLLINTSCALYSSKVPVLIFLQTIWKDIYILLMFKQIWSMIHASCIFNGKKLYGFIYGIGTLGSIFGSMIPKTFATSIGSEKIFFFTAPIYLFLMLSYYGVCQCSSVKQEGFDQALTQDSRAREAISLIKRVPLLTAV